MGKSDYAKNRKKHLEGYAKKYKLTFEGKWRGKSYSHILQFDEGKNSTECRKNKHKIVCEQNILPGVPTKMFTLKDMHKDAHHLNSSQVLCYNFFRPLITENGNPTDKLIELLEEQKVTISSSATCQFEFCPDKKEGTKFDFHIEDGNIEVFWEIKYTEYGFRKEKTDDSHKNKFTTTYDKYLNKQSCLKSRPDVEEFVNHYQLYRNIIRITDKNKYVIFLYPEANIKAKEEAETFISEKIKDEYKDNVLRLYWEKIVEENPELYSKYFAENNERL